MLVHKIGNLLALAVAFADIRSPMYILTVECVCNRPHPTVFLFVGSKEFFVLGKNGDGYEIVVAGVTAILLISEKGSYGNQHLDFGMPRDNIRI